MFTKSKVVVGVDPGIKATGIVLVEQYPLSFPSVRKGILFIEDLKSVEDVTKGTSGIFNPSAGVIQYVSVSDITTSFSTYITAEWLFPTIPQCAVIEKGVFMGFANEILLVAGWLGATLYELGIPVLYVNPSTAKKVVIGKGKARKDEVELKVSSKLNFALYNPPRKYAEHLWDAMLYALYGLEVT